MSGVAGGMRIKREFIYETFNNYVEQVLRPIPGFKRASLSGSVKSKAKKTFGDLDIIVLFEGTCKKEVKQRIISRINNLPEDLIHPFLSENYKDRKYNNSGELISVLFPIKGEEAGYVQVDNIVALTEEEAIFKEAFLDIPAEKQGLLLGLSKVVLLEQDNGEVFRRLGIQGLGELGDEEEYEFNLSSVKLSLRKVKVRDYKELAREEVWSTSNWGLVKILCRHYNIDGSFEDLLDDLHRKLKNPRSKNRVAGIFKSMISVKSGEKGTLKEITKTVALEKIAQSLAEAQEQQEKVVSLYAGGFKPPHKAHFENAKILAQNTDKLIIFIGTKIRDGIEVTPEQSKKIWEIYTKYLAVPVEVRISTEPPIRALYRWVDDNQAKVDKIVTGAIESDKDRLVTFIKNKDKYPKVQINTLPVLSDKEDKKLSATDIRLSQKYLESGKWIPKVVSKNDKQEILNIMQEKQSPEKELATKIDTILESFKKTVLSLENVSGTPLAASSAISSADRNELVNVYDTLRTQLDPDEFHVDFQQDRIYITKTADRDKVEDQTIHQRAILEVNTDEIKKHTTALTEYMISQGLNIEPLPELRLEENEEDLSNFFGKTAYYDPQERTIVVYTSGRLPKDIVRSFSHEMIHHKQNLEGRLTGINTANTNEDANLQEIEKEAYLEGNIMFRNWEDSVKKEQV